ncbi:MAG: hypothetical protein AB7P48_08600 [Methylocystis sp.]
MTIAAAASAQQKEPPAAPSAPVTTFDDKLVKIAEQAPGFGGMYFDEKGALQVYMKNAADLRGADAMKTARAQVASAIVSVLGADFLAPNAARKGRAQQPNIIKGDYDVVELARWKKSLGPALDGQEIVFVDLDERRNRVTVGVVGDPSRQRFEALAKSLGVPFDALIIEETQPIRFHASLRDKSRPVRAGVQIEIDTGVFAYKICTLGFNVVRNDRDGFITNSHCTKNRGVSNDDDIHQPNDPLLSGNKIGDEDRDPPYFTGGACPSGRKCRFSDSAYADYRIDRGPFEIARTTNNVGSLTINNFPGVFRIMSETPDSIVGARLNKVGRTTGWAFGDVRATCIDVNVADTDIRLLCQSRVARVSGTNKLTDHGDSGSPVFSILPTASQASLHGILWGGPDDGSSFVFSPMSLIEQELGPLTTFTAQQPPPPPQPEPTPREQCLRDCNAERDACLADGGLGSQCIPAWRRCREQCPAS